MFESVKAFYNFSQSKDLSPLHLDTNLSIYMLWKTFHTLIQNSKVGFKGTICVFALFHLLGEFLPLVFHK